MIAMENYILLDFCGTIVNFQTFDPFILFVLKKNRPVAYCMLTFKPLLFVVKIIQKFFDIFKINKFAYKMLIVTALKGLEYQKLVDLASEYYNEQIKVSLIPETMELIKKYREEQCRLIIVSAGCDMYVRLFAQEHQINDVISTELDFIDGRSTGLIKTECLNEYKVVLLNDYLKDRNLKGKFLVGITDSQSDLPLLNICKNKIVISKNQHQGWVTSDMEEIIWN